MKEGWNLGGDGQGYRKKLAKEKRIVQAIQVIEDKPFPKNASLVHIGYGQWIWVKNA